MLGGKKQKLPQKMTEIMFYYVSEEKSFTCQCISSNFCLYNQYRCIEIDENRKGIVMK